MERVKMFFHNFAVLLQIVFVIARKKVCVVIVENDKDIQTFSKGLRGKRHLSSLLRNAADDIEVQMNGFRKLTLKNRL